MRHYHSILLRCAPFVIASVVVSGNADAQDYTCGTVGTPYSNVCYAGITASGYTGTEITSDNGAGVYAWDDGTGQGAWLFSKSSAGVFGATNFTGQSPDWPSGTYGVYGTTTVDSPPMDSGNYGVFGYGKNNGDGVHGLSSYGSGSGVAGINSAGGSGVYGQSSTGNGVWGSSAGTGSSECAVKGTNTASSGGYGVYGSASGSNSYGGYFTTDTGYGVYAKATNGGTSTAPGVYGTSDVGNGVKGVTASTDTTHGGVSGYNSSSGYGIFGSSSSGIAIYGTSAGLSAIEGVNTATAGWGVYGVAQQASLSAGVYGTLSSAGAGVAVYGDNNSNASGAYAGYFRGNVYVSNDLTCGGATCGSDIRLKKNVKPLDRAIDRLIKLKGVTFEWKNPEEHNNHIGEQVGVIAQDVQPFYPQWVHETPDTKILTVQPDERTVLALTVESVRTLKVENDALKARADKQQGEINELRETVLAMKNGRDPISGGPGFGKGTLALFAAGLAGATGLVMKRMGLSLAAVVGMLIAGRKRDDDKRS